MGVAAGGQVAAHGAVRQPPAAGIRILLLAAAYALGGLLGRLLELEPVRVSPLWPAAGVAVAALLLWGRRLWPGVFLGSVIVNVGNLAETSGHLLVTLASTVGIAIGASLSAVIAATLVRRFGGERVPFHTVRGASSFVFLGALVAPILNAATGIASVRLAGYTPADQLVPAAVSWWLGDVVGILIVAPPLLLIGERHRVGPSRQPGEAIVALLLLGAAAATAFGPWVPLAREYPLSHIALPALVWASLRFGIAGASVGNIVIATIAVFGTVVARGPFASPDIDESLRLLQVFVAMESITFLLLASTLEERTAVERALVATRGQLEVRVAERTGELHKSLALLHATLDATADGILVVSREGRIVSFNRRFLELWHIPPETVAPGRDRQVLISVLGAVAEPEGFAERVQEIYANPEAESHDTVYLRDGRIFERLSRPQWLEGEPVGRVWSFRDVTARVLAERERDRLLVGEKQARHEAEIAHARTAFLADAARSLANSMSFSTTLRRTVALAVSAGARLAVLHLRDGGELSARAVAEVDGGVHGWEHEQDGGEPPCPDLRPYVRQAFEGAEVRRWEHTAATGPLYCVPMFSRGRVMGVLSVARDVDAPDFRADELQLIDALAERCAVAVENAALFREAQEAVRIRDDFLSIASHELKTPLTTLKLQLQKTQRLVRDDAADPRVQELLDSVVKQSARLHALIDSLLDISRITTHGLKLEREKLDLATLAAEAIERNREDAQRAGSTVHLDVQGDVTGCWDRMRVEQVVGNLISNAIKYGGGAPVDVRAFALGDFVRLEVEDHGIGISDEDQARIFERFERAVASRHFGGFGLGLWIVRQVVEALGGTIAVRSTPGAGSVFTVDLPRDMPRAEEAHVHH